MEYKLAIEELDIIQKKLEVFNWQKKQCLIQEMHMVKN
jgi:hypothetical protein